MCIHRVKRLVLTQLTAAIIVAPAIAASGGLSLAINDVSTHQAVQALIRGDGPELFSAYTDQAGRLKRDLPPGKYSLDISAKGYRGAKTNVIIESGKTSPLIVMLDPLNPPEEDQQLPSLLRPGFTLLHGYATDERGQLLQGVRVRLRESGRATFTNQRGYYWLSVPTPPQAAPDIPGTDTLIADKPGYVTVIHHNIVVAGEDGGGVFLGMKRGSGIEEHDDTHKQMR